MGGRGGGSAVSRERMQADFDALMREQGQLGPEQQIQRALRQSGGGWVDIADIRERTNLSRAQFDQALRGLAISGIVVTIPEENQRTLTPHRRAGGLSIGGDFSHLMRLQVGR